MKNTIISKFKEIVLAFPNKFAIINGYKSITFKELDIISDNFAHELNLQGVKRNDNVISLMENSIEEIITYISILKLGASYVPINMNDPYDRLKYIMQDTKARVIVTNSSNFSIDKANIVYIHESSMDNLLNKENAFSYIENESVYVIYTSGTTGVPKGVCVNSDAILSLMLDPQLCEFDPSDRFMHASNPAFDASTLEVWFPILNGITCCPAKNSAILNYNELSSTISELGITHVFFTTSLFHKIAEDATNIIECLKCIFVGGEQLSNTIVNKFINSTRKNCELQLINGYGPTESTVFATIHKLTKNMNYDVKIPIGKEIGGRECFVLNDSLMPLKIGEEGELYIAEKGIAEGYLNNSRLTDEKFVFINSLGKRAYKTGDLVTRDLDGNLYFEGRRDNQIKLRGFRIELSEIENKILSTLKIKNVATIYDNTKKIISAYLVSEGNYLTQDEIIVKLKEQLPDYMVPSRFCYVDEVPLNKNGKTDYEKLKTLQISWLSDFGSGRISGNAVEKQVFKLIAKIVNFDFIDFDSDLSVYGCSSIDSMSIARKISEIFCISITVGDILNNFSIAKLASYIISHKKDTVEKIKKDKGKKRLSGSQKQIWLHQKFDPLSPFYNESIAIKIAEKLDKIAFRKAINQITDKHEMLRVRIHEDEDGNFYQEICVESNLNLIEKDYTYLSESEALLKLKEFIKKEAVRPFKADSENLVRFFLCQIKSDYHILFILAHHVIIDGFSFYNIFLPELENFYEIFLNNNESVINIDTKNKTYFECYMHKNNHLEQNKIEFWKNELHNTEITTFENTAQYFTSHQGEMVDFIIDGAYVKKVYNFAKENEISVFSTALSVFFILLFKYTNKRQFVIGTVYAGRDLPYSDEIIGNFLNNILIRSDISSNETFIAFARKVSDKVKECIVNQLPFQDIVSQILPTINYTRDILPFDIAFVFEPQSSKTRWDLSQTEVHNGTTKFGLTFELDDRGDKIIGRAEYRTLTFDATFIKAFIENYKRVLEKILSNPYELIGEVSFDFIDGMLDKTENLKNLNHKSIIELWNNSCRKHSDLAAVSCKEKSITYRELDSISNNYAIWLSTNLDLQSQDIVAIHFDRSIDMVIIMLGILKAGCAYLPIDPDYPANRKEYIINDAKPKAIINDSKKELGIYHKTKIIDMISIEFKDVPGMVLNSPSPTDLAYIIYTSGSTGNPKGVLIEHKNVVHLIESTRDKFNFGKNDIWSCFHSYNFDFSVWEIWGALLTGGKVVVATERDRYSAENFIDLLIGKRVTVLNLTPSYFRLLDSFINEQQLGLNIKTIIFGGEALRPFELKNWFLRFKHKNIRYINMYGITEVTVHSTYYEVTENEILNSTKKSIIGSPLDHLNIYIVGDNLEKLPMGAEGEMYIEGPAVARGYLNKQDLTNERFIYNPYNGRELALFKTGDRAKYIAFNTLEYSGRRDHQVKIRGYRIELSEIDHALSKHSNIKKSFTALIENNGEKICSYVVSKIILSEDEIKKYLLLELPNYMIPNNVVFVENIPVNINGKVDVKKLPLPIQC